MVRVSEVMYGSHSAALMITYLKTDRSFVTNLTKVGKPAPPSPTDPLFFTASMKVARSRTSGGLIFPSGVCRPSLSISIQGTLAPFIIVISSIFCTLPDTLEWIGAEM